VEYTAEAAIPSAATTGTIDAADAAADANSADAADAAGATGATHATPAVTNKKIKILLAEDNKINRKLVTALAEKRRWDVTAVQNGKEAIDAILNRGCGVKDCFDLVLMDVQMPLMDGLEATKEIRKCKEWRDIPIIALTAHAIKGDKERFLEVGMTDYISKPIDYKEFYATIERYI
jgi:CheY-like chemotaxis protein